MTIQEMKDMPAVARKALLAVASEFNELASENCMEPNERVLNRRILARLSKKSGFSPFQIEQACERQGEVDIINDITMARDGGTLVSLD